MFVASDGTKFDDRRAMRRYEFETNYTFRKQENATLVKLPGQIQGQPFDLSDLKKCTVQLLDQCDQVQVDNVSDCNLFIGPCGESVFLRNCNDCVITVACKQLRTRDCSNCSIYLYSLTDPIIETSKDMKFAPFNGAYHGIAEHFQAARLEPSNNHWSQVFDFNDPDKTCCNWRLLHPNEEIPPVILSTNTDTSELPVNPVARDAKYIEYVESQNTTATLSFSFKTSQNEAQKKIDTSVGPAKDKLNQYKSSIVPPVPPISIELPPPAPAPPAVQAPNTTVPTKIQVPVASIPIKLQSPIESIPIKIQPPTKSVPVNAHSSCTTPINAHLNSGSPVKIKQEKFLYSNLSPQKIATINVPEPSQVSQDLLNLNLSETTNTSSPTMTTNVGDDDEQLITI